MGTSEGVKNEYLLKNSMGDRIKPNWLTVTFPDFVEKHGLPRMRFHDLRHSCASLCRKPTPSQPVGSNRRKGLKIAHSSF